MRFNSEAYEKVFPRKPTEPAPETVVPTFTPTSGDPVVEPVEEPNEEGGDDEDGNRRVGEPDSE